jgi:hypothetical protein
MTNAQIQYTVESYNTDPEGRPQQSDVAKVFAASRLEILLGYGLV